MEWRPQDSVREEVLPVLVVAALAEAPPGRSQPIIHGIVAAVAYSGLLLDPLPVLKAVSSEDAYPFGIFQAVVDGTPDFGSVSADWE